MKKNFIVQFLVLSAAGLLLTACPGGDGGGEVTLTNGPSSGNSSNVSLSLLTVNTYTIAQLQANGKIDNTDAIYFNTPTVTIVGTCSLGVAKVIATVDGSAVAETATCDSSGIFTWVKTFATGTPEAGTTYAIELIPALVDGTAYTGLTSSQKITKSVVIDDNTPAAATLPGSAVSGANDLGGGSYVISGAASTATFTVTMTVPADAYSVSITNVAGITVNLAGTTATFTQTLGIGGSQTYMAVVYDRAGNSSTTLNINVSYQSGITSVANKFTTSYSQKYVSSGSYQMIGGVSPVGGEVSSGAYLFNPGWGPLMESLDP